MRLKLCTTIHKEPIAQLVDREPRILRAKQRDYPWPTGGYVQGQYSRGKWSNRLVDRVRLAHLQELACTDAFSIT